MSSLADCQAWELPLLRDTSALVTTRNIGAELVAVDFFNGSFRFPSVSRHLACTRIDELPGKLLLHHGHVFVCAAYAVATVTGIRWLTALEGYAHVRVPQLVPKFLYDGMNAGFDAVPHSLAHVAQRLFAHVLAHDLTIRANAKVQLAMAMFVENRCDGLHALTQLGGAALEHDSLCFVAKVHLNPPA